MKLGRLGDGLELLAIADHVIEHHKSCVLVANKVDLLPADCSRARVADWVLAAARRSVPFLRDNLKSDDVRLVSCRTGSGVRELLGDARDEAAIGGATS